MLDKTLWRANQDRCFASTQRGQPGGNGPQATSGSQPAGGVQPTGAGGPSSTFGEEPTPADQALAATVRGGSAALPAPIRTVGQLKPLRGHRTPALRSAPFSAAAFGSPNRDRHQGNQQPAVEQPPHREAGQLDEHNGQLSLTHSAQSPVRCQSNGRARSRRTIRAPRSRSAPGGAQQAWSRLDSRVRGSPLMDL